MILVLVYLYFPFGALTLYSSIDHFDWNQLRAAMDLGASPLQAIFRILVPQIKPGIITAIIFVFIPILGEYLTPQIVGGTGGVMIGNLIANFFQAAEYTRGAAISLLVAGVHRLAAGRSSGSRCRRRRPMARDVEVASRRGRIARALLGWYALAIYVFLFAPIGLLVLFSFNANRYGTFPITGWTLDWYQQAFSDYQVHDAVSTTLKIALQVTVISAVVGTAAAFPLVRSRLPFREGIRIVLDPADHDPGHPDRRVAARAVHEHVPPDAVTGDGGDRAGGLHDAVRDPARRGAAAGLRQRARARCAPISVRTRTSGCDA